MNMPNNVAVRFDDVSKIYRLHGSQKDQFIDALNLGRFGFRPRTPASEFSALSNVSWQVNKGERVGIVGRNGAGKTTLLKLVCGNFAPTKGNVEVNGAVQALMSVGVGFHPDFTGRENLESTLNYNGLPSDKHDEAVRGVIDFCELGEFIDQPFKTYSLGMQARLMFAAATAIEPEILIVDEILSAGDAYFVAKSKQRVERLVSSGCTMLLVSHSMSQILELCDTAIWVDQGRIRMEGEAFLVVKAYEEYLYGAVSHLTSSASGGVESGERVTNEKGAESKRQLDESNVEKPKGEKLKGITENSDEARPIEKKLSPSPTQEPYFIPNQACPNFLNPANTGFHFLAPGGLSRWVDETPIRVVGFDIQTEAGSTNKIVCLRPARFIIHLEVQKEDGYECCYGMAVHDHMGNCVTRIFSACDSFQGSEGDYRRVELVLNPCQLGPGEYTVGISVTSYTGIERINEASRYDLLSRSFILQVALPDSLGTIEAQFVHSAEWSFSEGE
ncbi:ABC transporter ATP-binding protein [Pyruvatibacter mobilis]|uniref:ABC transporter ATP-binding protein n=1 Tax=Pyruvatibacter mobilis TaxID=1712261 RepID=UPI003BA9AA7D